MKNLPIYIISAIVIVFFLIITLFPNFLETVSQMLNPADETGMTNTDEYNEEVLQLVQRDSNTIINLENLQIQLPPNVNIAEAYVNNPTITSIQCTGQCSIYKLNVSEDIQYYLSTPNEMRFLPSTDFISGIEIENNENYQLRRYFYQTIKLDEAGNDIGGPNDAMLLKEATACSASSNFCLSSGIISPDEQTNKAQAEKFEEFVKVFFAGL